jgi:uncharacterized repeat protein (TIGR03803 family)
MLKSTSFLRNRRFLCAVLTLSAAVLLCAVSAPAATEKVLYVFTGPADGGYPNGDLVSDAAGNWYGTNNAATISVVFKLSPNGSGGWVSTAIHTFQGGTDGEESLGGVILDSSGNLYGTTAVGGQKFGGGSGIVFELSPDGSGGWTEHILYSFLGGLDGDEPAGALVLDAAGNLYGTTLGGGVDNAGTAFELSPMPDGSWTKRTIFNFGSYRGAAPFCSLIIDSVGNLYGTTEGTTAGTSVVFELMPSASGHWTERVLHTFGVGQDGAAAFGRLVFDKAGNLYGGTYGGGLYGYGTVFELMHAAPNNWKKKYCITSESLQQGKAPLAISSLIPLETFMV